MLHCVNKNHPEVLQLAKLLNLKPSVTAVKIGTWQTEHDTMDYPTVDQLQDVRSVRAIKKMIGLPSKKEISSTQLSIVQGRLRLYNDKFKTSHRLEGFPVGQSDLRTYTFTPDYTPKDQQRQAERDAARVDPDRGAKKKTDQLSFFSYPTAQGADTKLREKYFPTDTVKASEILTKISNSQHPLNKLAKHLLPFTRANNVPVTLVKGKLTNEGKLSLGIYYPSENKVEIAEGGDFGGKGAEGTILHEILHSLSVHYLAFEDRSTSSIEFKKLYRRAKIYMELDPFWKGRHVLSNEYEFLVGLFTDAQFIKELQKVPPALRDSKFKNLMEEIFDYLLGLLKITKTDTLYEQAFSVATNILQDQHDWFMAAEDTGTKDYYISTQASPQASLMEEVRKIGNQFEVLTQALDILQDDITTQAFKIKEGPNEALKAALVNRKIAPATVDHIISYAQEKKLYAYPLIEIIYAIQADLLLGNQETQAHYKATITQAEQELDTHLKKFLNDSLNVSVVKALTEHYGSPAAVTDILNKVVTVYESDGQTLPNASGRFFFELLGRQNPAQKQLLATVTSWHGYKELEAKYSKIYITKEGTPNIEKIKKEAVGQAIGEALIRNTKSKKDPFYQALQEAIDYIKGIIQKLKKFNFTTQVDDIAKGILNGTIELKHLDDTNFKRRTLATTLQKAPEVVEMLSKIGSTGALLTGSLAYRNQGALYRPDNEDVHDLDFRIPWSVWKGDIADYLEKLKQQYPDLYLKERTPGEPMVWESPTGDYMAAIVIINGISVDLFLQRTDDQNVENGMSSWYDAFMEKLRIGRPKDTYDLLQWKEFKPVNLNKKDSDFVYEEAKRAPQQAIRDFLQAVGVSIETVDKLIMESGDSADAAVTLSKRLGAIIRVVQGKEAQLTEEAAHILEILLEGTPLHAYMMADIINTSTYQEVKADPRYTKSYELAPQDTELLIRKEAVGKRIALYLTSANTPSTSPTPLNSTPKEKTIIQKVLQYLKRLFGKADPVKLEKDVMDAYALAAKMITSGDFSQLKSMPDALDVLTEDLTLYAAEARTIIQRTPAQYQRLQSGKQTAFITTVPEPKGTKKLIQKIGAPKDARLMELVTGNPVKVDFSGMSEAKKRRSLQVIAKKWGYTPEEFTKLLEKPVNGEIPPTVINAIKTNGVVYIVDFTKSYERSVALTAVPEINEYLVNLQNQIDILERQVGERSLEDDFYEGVLPETTHELNLRQKKADLVARKKELSKAVLDTEKNVLLDYALGPVDEKGKQAAIGGDLGELERQLGEFATMDLQQRWNWLANTRMSLENWHHMAAVLKDTFTGYEQERLTLLAGKVDWIGNKLDELSKVFLNDLLQKKTKMGNRVADYFAATDDISAIASNVLTPDSSGHQLVMALFELIDGASYAAGDAAKLDAREVDERTNRLMEWGKSQGKTEEQVWEMFDQLQRELDGSYSKTGNDIGKYKIEWYNKRRQLKEAGNPEVYNAWMDENATKTRKTIMVEENGVLVEKDYYTHRAEQQKEAFTRKVIDPNTGVTTTIFEEELYNKWVENNNPANLKKWEWNHWVRIEPKGDQWLDPKYQELLKPENKGALDFFEWWTNFKHEKIKAFPYYTSYKNPPNYLPALRKEMAWNQVFSGVSSFELKDGLALLYTEKSESPEVHDPIDPRTGKPILHIPIRMMSGGIPVAEKSNNRRAVGKALAATSIMYEKMRAQQGVVTAAMDIMQTMEVPTKTDLGVHKYLGTSKQHLYTKTPENALSMIESYIRGTMFGQKFDHEGAIKRKDATTETNAVKVVESLLTYTRWLGIGLDAGAASVELLMSMMAVYNNALEGDIITKQDADKGLLTALQTMEWLPTIAYVPGAPIRKMLSGEGSKAVALIKYMQLESDAKDPSSIKSKITGAIDDLMYYNQSAAEIFKTSMLMSAVMHAEEWKIKDKKGTLRPIWDAYLEKDGDISWNPEFEDQGFDLLGERKRDLATQIKTLKRIEFGTYDQTPKGWRSVFYRIAFVFRKWLPEAVSRRVDTEKARPGLGFDKEGNVRTTKGWYRSLGAYGDNTASLGEAFFQGTKDIALEMLSQTTFNLINPTRFESLTSKRDIANMRRIAADMKWTAAFAILMAWLLSSVDDDDDPMVKVILRYGAGQSYRLYSSVGQLLLPADGRSTQNLLPWSTAFSKFGAVFDSFTNVVMNDGLGIEELGPLEFKPDAYPSGPYVGRSRFWRSFIKTIPGVKEVQDIKELAVKDPFTGY